MILLRFLKDVGGNYALMTALLMVPLLGALALGVDYTEMSRQRQVTLHALDAAGIATARRILEGASEAEAHDYAQDFFRANLRSVDPAKVTLRVQLPSSQPGRETLRLDADLRYDPYFLPSFVMGTAETAESRRFSAHSEIRLQNTLEVALVLDNSGSMDFVGTGSGRKRMDLLKEAATELVETLAKRAQTMRQVSEPVRFSVVPFAGTVNVGPQHANASWMDTEGRSPIHHENFNWTTMETHNPNRTVERQGGVYRKKGSGWGSEENQIVTRFTLFDALSRITGTEQVQTGTTTRQHCTGFLWNRSCTTITEPVYETRKTYAPASSWAGCVETRPGNLAYDVTPPSSQNPASLFVPMFAPDETDLPDGWRRARGDWWDDLTESASNAYRQRFMPKYFEAAPLGTRAYMGIDQGPNAMCSTTTGVNTVKKAIADMRALGATDIPEGTAWGWRTLNSAAPFTQARPEQERGTDKVLIVLTDGFNTYYTPESLGAHDLANNRSVYSNKGYTGVNYDGGNRTRLFMNTTVNAGTHTNANFTLAMNQHLDRVCEDAKAAGVIVMTVALDLSSSIANERDAINAMTRCASDSRFRRDPNDPSKAAKLFWNANGSNLADKFREIADELSNLRIVG